ncbi:MAG: hypothetical protein KDA99_04145, partial [Planctomycetales bacterium]|nr:hypothetical protein [Planctomycetales bacterium]
MKMIRLLSFATMIAWMSMGSTAGATDYTWGVLGGGNQDWNTAANWSPAGVPSVLDDSANLNVDLSAPLTVDMGSNSLTVSQIKLGSTTNAVSTTITGSGQLILDSSGTPRIDSYGLPGTVDTISVPITLTKGLTINNQSNPHGTVELSGN